MDVKKLTMWVTFEKNGPKMGHTGMTPFSDILCILFLGETKESYQLFSIYGWSLYNTYYLIKTHMFWCTKSIFVFNYQLYIYEYFIFEPK